MRRSTLDALARVAVAATVAGGLLAAADRTNIRIDLAGSGAATTASRSLVTAVELPCPGTELGGVDGVEDLPTTAQVVAEAAPTQALGGLAGRLPAAGSLIARDLSGATPRDVAATSREGRLTATLTTPDPLLVLGGGALAPGVVTSAESLLDTDRVHGLMGLACVPPSAESWLFGGAAEPGHQERVLLVNTGANPVTVDLEILGRSGPIEAPAAAGLVVPAGGRTTFLLDAVAGGERAPVVHVRTRGGYVQATLNDYWLDGTTPRGVDDVGGAAPPSVHQVIPAVPGGLRGSVRVTAVGEQDALVQVRVITADGRVALPAAAGVAQVPAGAVREVAFSALPGDAVALDVTSDQPIVAAASTVVSANGVRDFAWSPSTRAIGGLAGTAYPVDSPGHRVRRTLSLTATAAPATAQVVLVGASGVVTERSVEVAGDSVVNISLDGTRAVWVRRSGGRGELRAGMVSAVGDRGRDGIAARPLTTSRVAAHDLDVIAWDDQTP